MRRSVHVWLGLAVFTVAPGVVAQESPTAAVSGGWESRDPLVTDRPDFTESALTVHPGHAQVEMGYTLARVAGDTEHSVGEVLIRVGLADRLEARVGLNSFAWVAAEGNDPEGLEDISLGAKATVLRATPGTARPDLGVLLTVSFPTGAADLGQGAHAMPVAVVAAGWEVTDRMSAGANVGWGYLDDGGGRYSQFVASLALGFSLTERLGAYAEYFGLTPELGDGPNSHFLDGGLTFLVSRDIQLDARVGFSVDRADTDVFAGAGLAFRI